MGAQEGAADSTRNSELGEKVGCFKYTVELKYASAEGAAGEPHGPRLKLYNTYKEKVKTFEYDVDVINFSPSKENAIGINFCTPGTASGRSGVFDEFELSCWVYFLPVEDLDMIWRQMVMVTLGSALITSFSISITTLYIETSLKQAEQQHTFSTLTSVAESIATPLNTSTTMKYGLVLVVPLAIENANNLTKYDMDNIRASGQKLMRSCMITNEPIYFVARDQYRHEVRTTSRPDIIRKCNFKMVAVDSEQESKILKLFKVDGVTCTEII